MIEITVNNPLVHLYTAKLGAVEQRWVAQLANYDYEIRYRSGRAHVNPPPCHWVIDALSLMPCGCLVKAASPTDFSSARPPDCCRADERGMTEWKPQAYSSISDRTQQHRR